MSTVATRTISRIRLLTAATKALEANADTTGWSPTGIHEHAEDPEGCNWSINYLRGDSKDADVKEIVMPAAEAIINELRKQYNFR
ncbi:hypothetical protein PQR67_30110 [Paraburkholderia fungorum]|uniref:hypothetical protein n=1 Tax=Paraburkholderia fungorum TaxID=134537 RepID=UPI0038BE13F2